MAQIKVIITYIAATLFILSWWYLAFNFTENAKKNSPQALSHNNLSFVSLSQLNRETLHKALSGDIELITQLIAKWDLDAQLFEMAGYAKIKRLPQHLYLRSQVLGQELLKASSRHHNTTSNPKIVIDDVGRSICPDPSFQRFLPQTYTTASFLLALTNHEQIVALPSGLRKHTDLFCKKLTDKIPLDIDRFNAEALFLAQPQIAFVAHYSDPTILAALCAQQVQLFTIKALDSVSDITDTLLRIGDVVGRPLEAELLVLFMDSAMQAIDNHMIVWRSSISQPSEQVLFLNYNSQFSTISAHTLTGELLMRMGISFLSNTHSHSNVRVIPIEYEQIDNFNPSYIIISTADPDSAKIGLLHHSALNQFKQAHLSFVDSFVQQFPSQYIVLAYYDLFNAITTVTLP